ncbi:enoyl-CoA hydratase [Nocardia sp. NPDC056000]|uniref:enoyl-CoA hydratase n=1 Tax=Nocardia sp. NPDC056000 TaxID=3345674 RepID=UPI0035E29153
MSDYAFLRYESHADGTIVRIVLDRPQTRNAQHRGLLVELDEAFRRAETDDRVRVVILAGAGAVFSSGHDLGSPEALAEMLPGSTGHRSFAGNGGTRESVERRMIQEWHYFFQNTLRWRDLRKITIAEVQGGVYAAGLMLMWACDLVIAAEGTRFADPVGPRLGGAGVEYFAHPWEFGPRKAKELLLTGDAIDAEEAYRLGMINKIFPADQLPARTLEFAGRVAALPSMASLMVKESVNQSVDAQGFRTALTSVFSLHHVLHAHWAELHGGGAAYATEADGVGDWQAAPPMTVATKDTVGGR